ncbi:MAG: hypothetical protein J7L62_00255, partial [Candidatus Aminicenantes bacterium]|nr:hypothetical protein [Candidatus Aminicenantes bacterium]
MALRCTFICDIKSSRKLKNWRNIFSSIENTLIRVNKEFKEEVFVEFKPTVGDEFQGVLKSSRYAYDVYLFLKKNIPAGFYCGIGVGEVEKTKKDVGMRGTAFYRAREALEKCKE